MALKQLLWLRGKLVLRGFTRSRSVLIGVVLGLLFLAPMALGLAWGIGQGVLRLELPVAENLLRGALLLVGAIWTIGPLLGFQLNEAQDITRLFVYPVPVRKLFLAAVLGGLLDLTALLLQPSLVAVILGAGARNPAGAVVALVAMPLFLFQTLAASQAITLALQGVLQSRKWRDIALLIVPLFWMSWQFGMQTLSRNAVRTDWKALLASPMWEWASLLPPGLAARAVGAGMKGMWPLAIAYLGALGLTTLLTFAISAWVVERAYRGEAVGVPAPVPQERTSRQPRGRERGSASGVIAAIFRKEWALFTRDPYFRLMAMNFVYMLGLGLFMAFRPSRGAEGSAIFSEARSLLAIWMATSLILFQQSILSYNIFGPEANAAQLLFAYPARRRELLIGKNLAGLSAILPLNLAATIVLCTSLKRVELLVVVLPWMLCASVLLTAVGNAVSVMLPYRVNPQGMRARGGNNGSAAYGFASLGVSLAALILYVPVLAAVLVPWYIVSSVWLWLTIPLALAYTAGLYFLSLHLTEGWLLEREARIIEKVARPEG